MTEIKPEIVDGEPVCSGKLCPIFAICEEWVGGFCGENKVYHRDPCIPGLRQQRDEARREVCDCKWRGFPGTHDIQVRRYAKERGWHSLYSEE